MVNMSDDTENKRDVLKAGTLICPTCCVEYDEIEFDFEFNGVILHNVKALKCPLCHKELFTPEQYETILKRLSDHSSQ